MSSRDMSPLQIGDKWVPARLGALSEWVEILALHADGVLFRRNDGRINGLPRNEFQATFVAIAPIPPGLFPRWINVNDSGLGATCTSRQLADDTAGEIRYAVIRLELLANGEMKLVREPVTFVTDS
jgi:hypothetical protein